MKIVYAPIVLAKLKIIKTDIAERFSEEKASKAIKEIIDRVSSLEDFPMQGVALAGIYDIVSDYRYLFINHNYVFYRISCEEVHIVEIFHEREDFIRKLFGDIQ